MLATISPSDAWFARLRVTAAALPRQAHALALRLPEALCIERAMSRVDHEGGVDGPSAPAIVRRMNASIVRAGLPAIAEGIASVSARPRRTLAVL